MTPQKPFTCSFAFCSACLNFVESILMKFPIQFLGEDTALSDQPYRYLTVDEMKSLGDDSLPIDVTRDERADNKMMTSTESAMASSMPPQALEDSISPQHITMQQTSGRTVTDYAVAADNIVIDRHPQHIGYVNFLAFIFSREPFMKFALKHPLTLL